MKRLFLIPYLFAVLLTTSCSKSTIDPQAPSKPDILFNQIKDDPQFRQCFNLVNASIKVLSKNIEHINPADTIVIQDKSLSYSEKSAVLGFTGDAQMSNNYKESAKLLSDLSTKYPLLNQLTDEERKVFYKKVTAYFLNPSKK